MARNMDKMEMLKVSEAASLLGMQKRTLDAWRGLGKGPAYHVVGKKAIRYKRCDLEDYLNKRKIDVSGEG